jgi:hypothetical protein
LYMYCLFVPWLQIAASCLYHQFCIIHSRLCLPARHCVLYLCLVCGVCGVYLFAFVCSGVCVRVMGPVGVAPNDLTRLFRTFVSCDACDWLLRH